MSDIAFHITDIVNNSLAAGADRIGIELTLHDGCLTMLVEDNGCGMEPAALERIADPFFTSRTVRRVGLGVPLLVQAAEGAGGTVAVTSQAGCGTRVEALFPLENPDCPPAGDIAEAVALLLTGAPEADLSVAFVCGGRAFATSTRQIAEALGEVPLWTPAAFSAIHSLLSHNFYEVFGGVLID